MCDDLITGERDLKYKGGISVISLIGAHRDLLNSRHFFILILQIFLRNELKISFLSLLVFDKKNSNKQQIYFGFFRFNRNFLKNGVGFSKKWR